MRGTIRFSVQARSLEDPHVHTQYAPVSSLPVASGHPRQRVVELFEQPKKAAWFSTPNHCNPLGKRLYCEAKLTPDTTVTPTKQQARETLRSLVEKLEREKLAGKLEQYNESETKNGFIEPLLQLLGWDTQNRNEVGLEENISGGRVDYSLKINGSPKVYVEAKPPRVKLTGEEVVTQAITYGYNKRTVNWVLLTDFTEFRLFDVTIRPTKRNVEAGLRLDLTSQQYLDRFDELWLLSKESVESGLLDRTLLPKKLAKLRRPVDKEILDDMQRWRELLAKNIYKNQPEITEAQLKEHVQRILDRIIFIRACEDRRLSYGESLKDMVLQRRDDIGPAFMPALKKLFRQYDRDYNSELFDEHPCEDLAIDFPVLKEIILGTYDPYLFDVIGVEVLGNIYEQYLGYVPRLTEKRVKYEPKPEVRKAGGIFYTPEYIVDYIVRNTVGRFLSERKPKEVQTLRILDPACGSGSFLIRAYQEMEFYYQRLKKEAWEKRQQTLAKVFEDQAPFSFDEGSLEARWELNVFDKRKLVLEHIFGVDLDEQAVEVSRLSLMLKMLEGEHGITPGRAVLPTLDYNIQCGNSLISGDVLKLQSFFKEDWTKTKSFDWDAHFRKIVVGEDGFDVIIGNPPYVRIQTLPKDQVTFFNKNFVSATGNYDIYALFVEQGLKLLKPGDILGYILPHKFFQAAYGQGLRKLIAEQKALMEVVNFRDNQIFEEASTYTCLLFLRKSSSDKTTTFKYTEVMKLDDPEKKLRLITENDEYQDDRMRIGKIPKKQVTEQPWSFSFGAETDLLDKIRSIGIPLAELADRMFQGIRTSANEVYVLETVRSSKNAQILHSEALNQDIELEMELLYPFLKGNEIRRYTCEESNQAVLIPYRIQEGKTRLLSEQELENRYPMTWKYLLSNKKPLESRENGKMKGEGWYGYVYPKNLDLIGKPRIITRDIVDSVSFALDQAGKNVFVSGYGITLKDDRYSLKFILALLNSRLLDFIFKKVSTPLRGGFFRTFSQFFGLLSIRTIDFNSSNEKKLHDDLVKLVEVMLNLHQREQKAKGHELEQLKRQIEKTDLEIDERVYELYGITERERKIVEGELRA
jgi:type I restriction-modification system DNA methylase subunit